ncbi:hypothetical protein F7734_38820 [Scytonema sp. UIC 10036]|uniref:DUF7219 family protein n=1 Tax=Scytonema sp. UIC 10036 TaxID=2304196 RepID=UPI0012DA629F|nr:hypothetical protein [Scytonema sp. UIC 10036]MUG97945.1 hypothetical protein [Scytonema sp. UIC 10036]
MVSSKDNFIYPRGHYYGQIKPENLVFNSNLQEFAQRVSYICSLETAGKISPEDAYERVRELWKTLKRSKQELRIGEDPFKNSDQ